MCLHCGRCLGLLTFIYLLNASVLKHSLSSYSFCRKLKKGYPVMLLHLLIGVVDGRIRHEELHIMAAAAEFHKLEHCFMLCGNY